MATTDALPAAPFQPRPSGRGQNPRVCTIGLKRLALVFQNIMPGVREMLRRPDPPSTSPARPRDSVVRTVSGLSQRSSGVRLPVVEDPTRRDIRIDDAVDVVGPDVQAVQQPRAKCANFNDRVSNQLAGFLRLQQIRFLLHLAPTIGFQARVGRDRTVLAIPTAMVKTPPNVARQPRTVARERNQIHHSEKCIETAIVLNSPLYPALTGAAG